MLALGRDTAGCLPNRAGIRPGPDLYPPVSLLSWACTQTQTVCCGCAGSGPGGAVLVPVHPATAEAGRGARRRHLPEVSEPSNMPHSCPKRDTKPVLGPVITS